MSERRGLVGKDLKKPPAGAQKPTAGKPVMGSGPQAAMVSKQGQAAGKTGLNTKAGGSRSVLSYEEVALALKVEEDRVHEWVRKGLLKGSAQGIQPYELEKFKTTQLGEIKRAQADLAAPSKGAATKSPKKPEKTPVKGAKTSTKKVEKLPTKSAASENERQNKALDFIRSCLASIQESVKGAFSIKRREPEPGPPKLQVVEGGKRGRDPSSGRSKRKTGDSGSLPPVEELLHPQEVAPPPREEYEQVDAPAWGPSHTLPVEEALAEQATGPSAPISPVSHGGWDEAPPPPANPWADQPTYSHTMSVEQAMAEQALGPPAPITPVSHGGWGDTQASPTSWDSPGGSPWGQETYAQTMSVEQALAEQALGRSPQQGPINPVAHGGWDSPAQPVTHSWDAAPESNPWGSSTGQPWDQPAEPVQTWEQAAPTPALAWDQPIETTPAPTWEQPAEPAPAPAWEQPAEPAPAPAWDQPAEPAPAPAWDQPAEPAPAPAWDQPAEPTPASIWDQPAEPTPASIWDQPAEPTPAWEQPVAPATWDQAAPPTLVWDQPAVSPWDQPPESTDVWNQSAPQTSPPKHAWEGIGAPLASQPLAAATWELQPTPALAPSAPPASPWEAEPISEAPTPWNSGEKASLQAPWETTGPAPETETLPVQVETPTWTTPEAPLAGPAEDPVTADDWLTETPAATEPGPGGPAIEPVGPEVRGSLFEPSVPGERMPGPSLSAPAAEGQSFKLSPRFELKSRLGPDTGERRVRREPLLKSPLSPRPEAVVPLGESIAPSAVHAASTDPDAPSQALVQSQQQMLEQLEAQRNEQQQASAARDERIHQLEEELSRALSVAEERSRAATSLELERETLRREGQQLGQSLAEHQQRLATLEQQIQRNNLELTYAASELNRLSQAETGVQGMAEKARLLESELNDARRDLSVARSRISAIQTEMVGKEARYLKLEQEFEELSSRPVRSDSSGERQLADMQMALAQRDQRLQELESQIATRTQRWEAELQKAGAWVAQMNEAVAARDKKVADLEARLTATSGRTGGDPQAAAELMAARVELSSLRRNAEVARLNSLKLETELSESRAALQRGQAAMGGLERQIKEIQQQREQLEHRLSEGRVVLEELRAENSSLRSQLNEAVRRLELAQRAFSNSSAGGDSGELARLQAHIKQLESEVVATMVRLSSSEKERIELEQRLRESGA